ncbi:RNA-binding protein [Achromobacter deleyi]|uniref:RNA-binding protein n=1 Tax=Achromobacter deleyi TaxID=1353891 RepID=UPI0014932572|nr:RNA-binding protein [Achromobacter deleyi]QVQ28319.1 RNA-binding protein [Achromobacter deleyi]
MAALLINHVEDSTSDDDIRAFLLKYGFPSLDRIQRVPSDGNRPAVLITFNSATEAELHTLLPRIHQVFWKNHTITALVMRAPIE